MKEVKLSIIVPIYKVEDYIYKCVDSILAQTFTDFELILVDDGSPDNCPKICDEYALKDERVKVIHKENGGLSDARNAGIEIARGEYLAFVDSDDFLSLDMYEKLIALADSNSADVVVCDYVLAYVNKEPIFEDSTDLFVMGREEALTQMICNRLFSVNAWNKIYKRELFEVERYPKGMLYEDLALTYRLIDKSEKIVYTPAKKYAYLQRGTSIMGQTGYKMKKDKVTIVEDMIEYFKGRDNYLKICSGISSYLLNDVYKMAVSGNLTSCKEYVEELKACVKKYKKELQKNKYISFKDRVVLRLAVKNAKFLQFMYGKIRRG